MVRKEETESELLISLARDVSLVVIAVCVVMMFIYIPSEKTGIYAGCEIANRFTYHFFHASTIHLLMNLWCFASVVFLFPVKVWAIAASFLIATTFPVNLAFDLGADILAEPTIGLSGVCFALIGDCSHFVKVKSKLIDYHLYMAFFILLGFCFDNVNQWIHLYCYVMGCFFGYNSFREP